MFNAVSSLDSILSVLVVFKYIKIMMTRMQGNVAVCL